MLMLPPSAGDSFTGKSGFAYSSTAASVEVGNSDVAMALQRGWSEQTYPNPPTTSLLPKATTLPSGSVAYTSDQGLVTNNGFAWSAVSGNGAIGKNLIFDSQFITDADVYSGLRILAWAHKQGIINLLAITNCFTNTSVTVEDAPMVISQFLATAGVSGIPIAKGPTTTAVTAASTAIGSILSQSFTPSRRVLTSLGLDSAVPVLRRALANATTPVDILANGTANNLYDLLNSAADAISPLTGMQLITQKVRELYWVGGVYPSANATSGPEYNFGNVPGFTTALWNVTKSILASWPTPIIFVGLEIGAYASTGAYNGITVTDPLGYMYFNYASGTYGRQGWGPVSALIALQGFSKAGFTRILGTNTIDTGTGYNTFVPGVGSHSYVVPAVSQRALQQAIDAICAPGVTQPTLFTQVAESIPTSLGVAGPTDAQNLIVWYKADDINQANASAVASWSDRCGRANLVQATGGLQPTYATALVSKIAVSFAGTQILATDVNLDLPHEISIYGLVDCASFSTSRMGVLGHMVATGATTMRNIGLSRSRNNATDGTNSTALGYSTIQNTFTTQAASAVSTINTWVTYALVRTGSTITVYLNGVNAASAAIAYPANFLTAAALAVSNHILGPLNVGGTFVNAGVVQEGWNGGIREVRIYNHAHTAAQVATISAEMT
jgi:hypothetical protein